MQTFWLTIIKLKNTKYTRKYWKITQYGVKTIAIVYIIMYTVNDYGLNSGKKSQNIEIT